MMAITLLFGAPLLLAAAMISPTNINLTGLVSAGFVVFIGLPFVAWPTFLIEAASPSLRANSRFGSFLRFWLGATLVVVGMLYFVQSVLDYPRPGVRIGSDTHLLIPFMPRFGLALGLFCICMLVSCGLWGAAATVLRSEVALPGAVITGCGLFTVLYAAGWFLS